MLKSLVIYLANKLYSDLFTEPISVENVEQLSLGRFLSTYLLFDVAFMINHILFKLKKTGSIVLVHLSLRVDQLNKHLPPELQLEQLRLKQVTLKIPWFNLLEEQTEIIAEGEDSNCETKRRVVMHFLLGERRVTYNDV
jgi:hypothetical protein